MTKIETYLNQNHYLYVCSNHVYIADELERGRKTRIEFFFKYRIINSTNIFDTIEKWECFVFISLATIESQKLSPKRWEWLEIGSPREHWFLIYMGLNRLDESQNSNGEVFSNIRGVALRSNQNYRLIWNVKDMSVVNTHYYHYFVYLRACMCVCMLEHVLNEPTHYRLDLHTAISNKYIEIRWWMCTLVCVYVNNIRTTPIQLTSPLFIPITGL